MWVWVWVWVFVCLFVCFFLCSVGWLVVYVFVCVHVGVSVCLVLHCGREESTSVGEWVGGVSRHQCSVAPARDDPLALGEEEPLKGLGILPGCGLLPSPLLVHVAEGEPEPRRRV